MRGSFKIKTDSLNNIALPRGILCTARLGPDAQKHSLECQNCSQKPAGFNFKRTRYSFLLHGVLVIIACTGIGGAVSGNFQYGLMSSAASTSVN